MRYLFAFLIFASVIGCFNYSTPYVEELMHQADASLAVAEKAVLDAADWKAQAIYWKAVADTCRGTIPEIHPKSQLRTQDDTLADPLENGTSTGANNSLPATPLGGGAGGLPTR